MPFVEYPQKIMGFTIKKRLGLPNMFGWIIPGWSQFGDDNILAVYIKIGGLGEAMV